MKKQPFKRPSQIAEPNRYDWDFHALPSDQLQDCVWYEYARESSTIIEEVKAWRKCRRLKLSATEGERRLPVRQALLGQRLRILILCPEFPAKPWQDILASERVKRINRRQEFLAIFETHSSRKAFEVLDPLKYVLRVQAIIPRAQAAKEFPGFQDISFGGMHDVFCEIDFDQNEGRIIKDFAEWVRRVKRKQAKHHDKDRTSRTCRELLKALGALRLLGHYRQTEPSQEKAIWTATAYTETVSGKPLYSSRESWLKAVKSANKYMSQM